MCACVRACVCARVRLCVSMSMSLSLSTFVSTCVYSVRVIDICVCDYTTKKHHTYARRATRHDAFQRNAHFFSMHLTEFVSLSGRGSLGRFLAGAYYLKVSPRTEIRGFESWWQWWREGLPAILLACCSISGTGWLCEHVHQQGSGGR